MKERRWVPCQAAEEYFRNRRSEIATEHTQYKVFQESLCQIFNRQKVC
ncbi:hypothetical protein [Planctomicrobium sp. SH664]